MKKLSMIVISLLLVFALIAACAPADTPAPAPGTDTAPPAQNETPDDPTPPPAVDGPATEITIWFMGGSATDDSDVIAAANARLQELGLNITINPIWSGGWSMQEEAQIALDTGDTSVDIFWTGSWGLLYAPNATRGNFVRLDDPNNDLLAQYGQDMLAAVPEFLWDAFAVNGPQGFGIYGIPGYKDFAQLYTWDVNNTRLSGLGIDFDDLFDMDGINYDVIFDPLFEEAMQRAKDEYGPTFFPLAMEGGGWARMISNGDTDLTGADLMHFTFDPNNPAEPTDFLPGLAIENELTLRVYDRLHHFWNQGFIDPRAAIPGEAASVFIDQREAGEYLFATTVYAYGHTTQASASRGIDARFPRMSNPIVSTVSATGSGFAVSVYSRNQAAAVQFMNAWYTDQTLADILVEGVEGVHHTRNADGTLTRLPGGRDRYAPWRFGMGNVFTFSPLDTEGPDYLEGFLAYNAAGIPVTFLGFTFDPANVLTEMSALSAVWDEFGQSLEVGAVEPRAGTEAFAAALRANGFDRFEAELHRQLEEFFAAR
ncbi:MAG: ABC transporter substrate-binding protein [Oscillospiraceae bacterium]|nr:ABC transporter substrate-binding protein [Oscillospiraceae bacterium]MCL2278402.1 ABC transporter substrate-binding protein [Oscillospiraceae bacterium]